MRGRREEDDVSLTLRVRKELGQIEELWYQLLDISGTL